MLTILSARFGNEVICSIECISARVPSMNLPKDNSTETFKGRSSWRSRISNALLLREEKRQQISKILSTNTLLGVVDDELQLRHVPNAVDWPGLTAFIRRFVVVGSLTAYIH